MVRTKRGVKWASRRISERLRQSFRTQRNPMSHLRKGAVYLQSARAEPHFLRLLSNLLQSLHITAGHLLGILTILMSHFPIIQLCGILGCFYHIKSIVALLIWNFPHRAFVWSLGPSFTSTVGYLQGAMQRQARLYHPGNNLPVPTWATLLLCLHFFPLLISSSWLKMLKAFCCAVQSPESLASQKQPSEV